MVSGSSIILRSNFNSNYFKFSFYYYGTYTWITGSPYRAKSPKDRRIQQRLTKTTNESSYEEVVQGTTK